MNIDDRMMAYIANLAQLEMSEEGKCAVKGDLEMMISYIEKLEQLDTDHIEPLVHLSSNHNMFRKDCPQSIFERTDMMQNAPKSENGYFKVNKTIE